MRTKEGRGIVIACSSRGGVIVVREPNGNIVHLRKNGKLGETVSFMKTDFIYSNWGPSTHSASGKLPAKRRTGEFVDEQGVLNIVMEPHPYKKIRTHPIKKTKLPEALPVPPEEPAKPPVEEPCPYSGLVVASKKGYWLIEIDPYSKFDSRIIWLGNDETGKCIVENIGEVRKYSTSGSVSGTPARWAFEDGIRKYTMPSKYTTTILFPYRKAIIWDDAQDFPGQSDTVSFAHYGYFLPAYKVRGGIRSMAYPGGIFGAFSYTWFSRKYLGMAIESTDFTMIDTTGMDLGASGNSSYGQDPTLPRIRMIALDEKIECTNPTYTSGNINTRIREKVNNARACEHSVQGLLDSAELLAVAQDYADEMALNDWMSHTGPAPDNSTLDERAIAGGLVYINLGEVLALVPDGTVDEIADTIFTAWKNSQEHWEALMSDIFFRSAFAVAQSVSTGSWYACGMLMTKSSDEFMYTGMQVRLPLSPDIEEIAENPLGLWTTNVLYSTYRAFSSVPREEFKVLNVTRQAFSGNMDIGYPWFVFMSDNFDYFSDSGVLESSEGTPFNTIGPGNAIDEYPKMMFGTNGAWIRDRQVNVNFMLQYNGGTHDILVELEPLSDTMTDPSVELTDVGQLNQIPTSNNGGNTTLYVGTCVVDHAQRGRFHGEPLNPFQTITVASVFHSNSGFTVITYTVTETLYNDHFYWDKAVGDTTRTIYQKYFKLRQTLWCAVIYNDTLYARWELKGFDRPATAQNEFVSTAVTLIQEAHPNEQQNFIHNFNKPIESGSVTITCIVDGYNVTLTDNGDKTLTEAQYQHPDHQFVLATSDINYDAGVVNFTFGSVYPDAETDIIITAKIGTAFNDLVSLEATTEIIAMVDADADYDEESVLSHTSINTAGVYPGGITATITEDGLHVIFSFSLFHIQQALLINRPVFTALPDSKDVASTYNIVHDGNDPQVIAYQLDPTKFGVEIQEPIEATAPLYLEGESITETVVLN